MSLYAKFLEAAEERPIDIGLVRYPSGALALRASTQPACVGRRARREVARARRGNHTLTVALVDIDHFKAYNDTYGHLAGDALLRDLGAAWRTMLRVTDLVARYGGEEFAVLLPARPSSRPSFQAVAVSIINAGRNRSRESSCRR